VNSLRLTLSRAAREPLLLFLLLSAVVFGLDAAFGGGRDARRVITVDRPLAESLKESFERGQGRAPNSKEMNDLVYRWVQNEVIYREALALGLDKGDDMIRERIITKLRQITMDNAVVDRPGENELQQWFEQNKAYYSLPVRYDFSQILLPGADQANAARIAATLAGSAPSAELADQLRRYDGRQRENIEQMFGPDFAAALASQPAGEWRAAQSQYGWHVVRLETRHEARQASLEDVRDRAEAEWMAMQRKRRVAEAIEEIRGRYDVRMDFDE